MTEEQVKQIVIDIIEEIAAGSFPIRQTVLPGLVGGDLYRADETIVVRPDGVVAARTTGDIDLAELGARGGPKWK